MVATIIDSCAIRDFYVPLLIHYLSTLPLPEIYDIRIDKGGVGGANITNLALKFESPPEAVKITVEDKPLGADQAPSKVFNIEVTNVNAVCSFNALIDVQTVVHKGTVTADATLQASQGTLSIQVAIHAPSSRPSPISLQSIVVDAKIHMQKMKVNLVKKDAEKKSKTKSMIASSAAQLIASVVEDYIAKRALEAVNEWLGSDGLAALNGDLAEAIASPLPATVYASIADPPDMWDGYVAALEAARVAKKVVVVEFSRSLSFLADIIAALLHPEAAESRNAKSQAQLGDGHGPVQLPSAEVAEDRGVLMLMRAVQEASQAGKAALESGGGVAAATGVAAPAQPAAAGAASVPQSGSSGSNPPAHPQPTAATSAAAAVAGGTGEHHPKSSAVVGPANEADTASASVLTAQHQALEALALSPAEVEWVIKNVAFVRVRMPLQPPPEDGPVPLPPHLVEVMQQPGWCDDADALHGAQSAAVQLAQRMGLRPPIELHRPPFAHGVDLPTYALLRPLPPTHPPQEASKAPRPRCEKAKKFHDLARRSLGRTIELRKARNPFGTAAPPHPPTATAAAVAGPLHPPPGDSTERSAASVETAPSSARRNSAAAAAAATSTAPHFAPPSTEPPSQPSGSSTTTPRPVAPPTSTTPTTATGGKLFGFSWGSKKNKASKGSSEAHAAAPGEAGTSIASDAKSTGSRRGSETGGVPGATPPEDSLAPLSARSQTRSDTGSAPLSARASPPPRGDPPASNAVPPNGPPAVPHTTVEVTVPLAGGAAAPLLAHPTGPAPAGIPPLHPRRTSVDRRGSVPPSSAASPPHDIPSTKATPVPLLKLDAKVDGGAAHVSSSHPMSARSDAEQAGGAAQPIHSAGPSPRLALSQPSQAPAAPIDAAMLQSTIQRWSSAVADVAESQIAVARGFEVSHVVHSPDVVKILGMLKAALALSQTPGKS